MKSLNILVISAKCVMTLILKEIFPSHNPNGGIYVVKKYDDNNKQTYKDKSKCLIYINNCEVPSVPFRSVPPLLARYPLTFLFQIKPILKNKG